jgi:hypothetical protein
VEVHVIGGGAPVCQAFTLDQVKNALTGKYTPVLRFPSGQTLSLGTLVPLLSIRDLLAMVQIGAGTLDADNVSYVVVQAEGQGHPSVLRKADLSKTGDFPSGLLPSVFVVGGDTLAYYRPLRSATDVNSTEYVETQNAVIDVTAHVTGQPLGVSVHASATQVHVGDSTTFTARMAGDTTTTSAPQGKVSYTWDFTEGTPTPPRPQATATRKWTTQGTFSVTVSARDATGNYAQSSPVVVTVGAKQSPGGGTDPGSGHHHRHHHHRPPHGPVQGHGHQNHGQQHGTQHQTQHQSQGQNDGTTSSQSGSDHQHPSPSGQAHHDPVGPSHHQKPPPEVGGDTVAGLVLQGAKVYAVPEPSRTVPQISAAAERPTDHWALPWRILVGVGIPLALIGLGMAGETLQLRRRVARMSA